MEKLIGNISGAEIIISSISELWIDLVSDLLFLFSEMHVNELPSPLHFFKIYEGSISPLIRVFDDFHNWVAEIPYNQRVVKIEHYTISGNK